MVNKKKILVITGTRAEYGLLCPVMEEIEKSPKLSLLLLATGMHTLKKHGHTGQIIKKDGWPLKWVVSVGEHDDMLESLAKEITGIRAKCIRVRPDFIVVLGDRDEALAGALVGGHLGIPVAHIHGGETTGFSVDEHIRHAITKFASLHFPATARSYRNITEKLGEEKWRVKLSGAPGLDGLKKISYLSRSALSAELGLDMGKKWMILLLHPVVWEKTKPARQMNNLLCAVSRFFSEKIVIYPNADTGGREMIREIDRFSSRPGFHIFKNLERRVFLSLLKNAELLAGNSSAGIIESSYFKLPVINIGPRQQYREKGENILDCDYGEQAIARSVIHAMRPDFRKKCQKAKSSYGQGGAARAIVRSLEKNINNPNLLKKKMYV